MRTTRAGASPRGRARPAGSVATGLLGAASLAGSLAAALLAGPVAAQDTPLVVTGGRWLDVNTGALVDNEGIVAVGGRLLTVGSLDVAVDLGDARRLELS
ncbi:MAG: hypothetical protein HKO98_05695, partial [Gemmatimonadetes bacterium]|nr:hypothetical protein [Gemmatimonadota bacterium]